MRNACMRGWIGIAVYVMAYDMWAGATGNKTLSTEFRNHSRCQPAVMIPVTAYMVAHLFGAWPRRYDPLTQYFEGCGKLKRQVDRRLQDRRGRA